MKTSPQRFSLTVTRAFNRARTLPAALALCCAFILLNVCVHAQSSSSTIVVPVPVPNAQGVPQTPPRGQSVISGRVVYEDTGRPARSVQVLVFNPANPGGARRTATNARGEFRLKQVAAGRYRVVVEALGVALLSTPFPDENQSDTQEVSVDGTGNAEIEVRAKRGGVITGRVTYADGEPAIGARINLTRKRNDRPEPFYAGRRADSMRTDDRGVYRIAGLPPGDYIVSAAVENIRTEEMENGGVRYGGNGSLSVTYFPSASNARTATAVNVTQGTEAADINITLVERATHRVAGTVTVRRDNQPVAGASLTIRNKDDLGNYTNSQNVQANVQGRFTFSDVPDGTYLIKINPPRPEPTSMSANPEEMRKRFEESMRRFVPKQQEVSVAGADVTGLAIEMTEGSRIKGAVSVEGGGALPANIVVVAEGKDGGSAPFPGRVQPDGTWTLGGVAAGKVFLTVFVPGGKFYAKSIAVNGIDASREPLEVKDGVEINGVRVLLSSGVATLAGRLLGTDGTPARNMFVMLVVADPALRLNTRGSHLVTRTNSEGLFSVSGAPGEYFVIVFAQSIRFLKGDDDEIKPYLASPQRITLQPNERKSMDIVAPKSEK